MLTSSPVSLPVQSCVTLGESRSYADLYISRSPSPHTPLHKEPTPPGDDPLDATEMDAIWERYFAGSPKPLDRLPTPDVPCAPTPMPTPRHAAGSAPIPRFNFIQSLPRTLCPYSFTPTYVTSDGLMEYYLKGDRDGTSHVVFSGRVDALQDAFYPAPYGRAEDCVAPAQLTTDDPFVQTATAGARGAAARPVAPLPARAPYRAPEAHAGGAPKRSRVAAPLQNERHPAGVWGGAFD